MGIVSGNGRGENPEEAMKQREEAEARSQSMSTANQLAGQYAGQMGPTAPGYWDVIGDPDIARGLELDDEYLDEFVATEMSDKFALGNIKYRDWESWQWQIENEFWTMRNEFQDQDSKLDDVDMATMYGERRPKFTNERARRLRSASQVKKMMTSLSVGARGLRSGTEIHAVAKTEQPAEDEETGLLGGIKKKLV